MQVSVSSYFISPLLNFTEGTTRHGEQDLSLQIVPRDRQIIQGLLCIPSPAHPPPGHCM